MTEHHAPNIKLYLTIFGALMFLSVVTVAVSYLHLPVAGAVLVALIIASIKAGLVAAYFMHLKGEKVLIYGLLGLSVVLVIALYVIPIADSHLIAGEVMHGEASMAEAPSGEHAEKAK